MCSKEEIRDRKFDYKIPFSKLKYDESKQFTYSICKKVSYIRQKSTSTDTTHSEPNTEER